MTETNLSYIPRPDYANHPAYGKLFGTPSLAQRREAWRRFSPEFRRAWKTTRQTRKLQNETNGKSTPLYEQLKRDGALALQVPPEVLDPLRPLIDPHVQEVMQKRARLAPNERKFADTQVNLKKAPDEDPLIGKFQKIFKEMGIIEAASLYLGKPIKWVIGAVQMNDDTDIHLSHHFGDLGLEDPPTKYMHLDSTINILKCILYYTSVTADTGPFSYVLGSNRYRSSSLEYATRKANDISRLDGCDPETRKLFWALPSMFQHKAEFGNDLTDTKQMQALIAGERQFTSDAGNLIFFDNNAGVHRGALIKKGHRVIVQFILGG